MSKLRDETSSRTGPGPQIQMLLDMETILDYPEAICCVDIRSGPRPACPVATLLHYLHHTPAPSKMLPDYTISCV